jgi:P27 family predicted phage terminase small subunit
MALPRAPKELNADARKEWRRIVPILHKQGVLSDLDRSVLVAYCIAYARFLEANTELARSGLTQTSKNGYVTKHPALLIADKAMEQMGKCITQLGLSPAARSKIQNWESSTADDDDAFFEGK